VPNALVVPSEAIVIANSGKSTVMVVGNDGIAHQTAVSTGISGEGLTQILSGLSAGQQVVTTGAASLDDGTHVKIVASLDKDEDSGKSGAGDDDK
jgi:multidrug efflux pump subunit AcrA (membrane-fusion protein)